MTNLREKLRQNVGSIMTREMNYISPDTIMDKVAEIFELSPFHHIPVLNKKGKVLGMISKLDYHKLLNHYTIFQRSDIDLLNKNFLKTLTAEDIMSGNPVCIHLNASIESAIQVFLENVFHALPVVDDKVCIGIITPHDILKFIAKEAELLEENISATNEG